MRVTIQEAAKLLGMPEQHLRVALQNDKFEFGHAVKQSPNRWTYYINKKRLLEYIGGEDDGGSDDSGNLL